MTTMIPHSEYIRITQINSSPETIAALLNEAEAKYSSTPKHFNAKRVYPYWKICQRCLTPFPCHTKEQAARNHFCKLCIGLNVSDRKKGKNRKPRPICPICNNPFKPKSNLSLSKAKFCSPECYGQWRSTDLATVAHLKSIAGKGRQGWTEASLASYQQNMSGANNPAWKGGVTYFKTHGNYTGVKYIRCPLEYLPMARKDGYVMEHRLLVAQAIGRLLLRVEVVHHKDHNPGNNDLSNLQLFANNRDHKLYEHHGTPAPIWQL